MRSVLGTLSIALMLLLTSSPASHAQQVSPLTSMKLLTTTTGWVATGEKLFWTTNNGTHWKEITPLTKHKHQLLSSVFFLNDHAGWALIKCGDDTSPAVDDVCFEFARTLDAGESWSLTRPTIVDPVPARVVTDDGQGFSDTTFLDFVDTLHGWAILKRNLAVGRSSGEMLRTTDGGKTWIQLRPGTLPAAEPFSFANVRDGWIAAGPDQGLYVTHDAGNTWEALQLPIPKGVSSKLIPIYGLPEFKDEKVGYLPVTYESSMSSAVPVALFRTSDEGNTWQPISVSSALPDAHPWTPYPSAIVNGALLLATLSGDRISLIQVFAGSQPITHSGTYPVPASAVDKLTFVAPDKGWVLTNHSILSTSDGGSTWKDVTPDPRHSVHSILPSNASVKPTVSRMGTPESRAAPQGGSGGISAHLGFDTWPTPPIASMQVWANASPYYDIAIYLYGSPNKSPNQSFYPTVQWLSTVEGTYGWGIVPIWFGLQSSCIINQPNVTQYFGPTTADASTQGAQQADLAVTAAQALGITGGIIYTDIENYTVNNTCSPLVQAYVDAWVTEIHVYSGYLAGVYANPSPINNDISNPSVAQPDAIWITRTPIPGKPPQVTIWNQGISDTLWPNSQRMHQFLINQHATFGTTTINIDPDIDNGPVLNANSGAKAVSSYSLTSYSYPGASTTWFYGTNDISNGAFINTAGPTGQMVGAFCCSGSQPAWHGFYFDGISTWSPIQFPGEIAGGAYGINSAGQIVGSWEDQANCWHGYIYNAGTYTSYSNPNAVCAQGGTSFFGINDAGQVSGVYYTNSGWQSFVYYKNSYYLVGYPAQTYTSAWGLNGQGMITGASSGASGQIGFVEAPSPPSWTGPYNSFFDAAGIATFGRGISNNGDVAGYYEVSYQNDFALIWSDSVQFASFQYPPNQDTYATGVNDFGQVVGFYGGQSFVALPQP